MSPARLQGRRPHDPLEFAGRVELLTVESEALRGNPLGDPHVRELVVYLPPDVTPESVATLFLLSGFTGRGQSHLGTDAWKRGLLWKIDQAVAAGEMPPALLVLPDCFTNQLPPTGIVPREFRLLDLLDGHVEGMSVNGRYRRFNERG